MWLEITSLLVKVPRKQRIGPKYIIWNSKLRKIMCQLQQQEHTNATKKYCFLVLKIIDRESTSIRFLVTKFLVQKHMIDLTLMYLHLCCTKKMYLHLKTILLMLSSFENAIHLKTLFTTDHCSYKLRLWRDGTD